MRYVASDERTNSETAHILGAAIGQPDLNWVTFSDEQMRDGLEQSGIPAPIAALFVEMGASIHSGASQQDYNAHPTHTKTKSRPEYLVGIFMSTSFERRSCDKEVN